LELKDKLAKEFIILKNKLKTKSYEVITNDRKTYYEDQENDNLLYYFYLLNAFYILLLVLFLILCFFRTSSYNWIYRLAIFVFLLLYYFIGSFLLGKVIEIINKLIDFFPKNVYTNI
jgi:hypothetical protein